MSDLTFEDPSIGRKNSVAAGTRNLEQARQKRAEKAGKAQTTEDRDDPEIEAEVAQDPVAFMRKRLTKMLVRELAINDLLYSATPPEHKALTESNKRLMDLGESLKALPNQSDIDSKGSQRSLSELIQDALTTETSQYAEQSSALNAGMLARADAAFGLGAAEDTNGSGSSPSTPEA